MSAIKYWLWLSSLTNVRPAAKAALIDHYGDAERVWFAPEGEFRTVPGVSASQSAFIRKATRTALAAEGVDFPCEIDVRLTDDETIHEINREMREVDRATDVLSFPMFELTPGELPGEEDADPGTGLVPLGDMVISLEHVAAQAKEYGHSNRRELAYLVTHSVLHLLGYDHLDEGPMKAQMREHEEAIMKLPELER